MASHVKQCRFIIQIVGLVVTFATFCIAVAADAQPQGAQRRIGVLTVGGWADRTVQGLRQGLADAGYSEGCDLVIEWRHAGGDYDRLPQLASDLVQSRVEVIVVDSTRATLTLKRVTPSTPIVMAFVADPVGSGLVPSLAHPGGNIAGLSMMTPELSVKRLQLLN